MRWWDDGSVARAAPGADDVPPASSVPGMDGLVEAVLDLRLLLPALAAWVTVVVLLDRSPWLVASAAVLAAVTGEVIRRRAPDSSWARAVALCGLVTAVTAGCTAAAMIVRSAGSVTDLAADRASVTLVGVVAGDPRTLAANSERRSARVVVRIDVTEITGRGERSEVATPVLLLGSSAWASVHWRERVSVRGRLSPAGAGEDVVAVLAASGDPAVIDEAPLDARIAETVRAATRVAVGGLPDDAAGLIPGLVIGDTSLTPATLTDDMRATGLTHLCAVSGSNVAVVLSAALALCRGLRVPRRGRPVGAGLLLVVFVIVARPEPSVLRAAVMGSIGLVGSGLSRRGAGVPPLAGAVVVLLCIDPWLARSYGFALSTLATLGLLLFARPWGAWLRRHLPARLGWLGEAVAIPIAAQTLCAPVIAILAGSVTVVGVAANLLAAPMVAPATVLGVTVALLAVPLPAVAALVAWVAAVPALGIAWVAHATARVPFGTLPWPDGVPGGLLLAALTMLALLGAPWLMASARRWPRLALVILAAGIAALWPIPIAGWPVQGWRFVACDVGQGDALVLATGPHRAVLVDAGPDPDLVDACLSRLQVERLDAIVLTHFHVDHVGGLAGALRGRSVGQVFGTPVRDPPQEADKAANLVGEAGGLIEPLYAGDVLIWGDVTARVRWPERRIDAGSVPNNNGVVLDVLQAHLRLLLLADVEREAAADLRQDLAADGAEGIDVVKIAHHGSANQDPALLELVHAPVGVISVGADNDYGHPAPALLSELAKRGTTVFRTDRDGDVLIGLDGSTVTVARSRS